MTDPSDAVESEGVWRSAIADLTVEWVDPTDLLAHPLNARRHPGSQRDALRESLGRVGWVDIVKVNRRTGHVVDGHARIEEAITAARPVPVLYLDMDEEDERYVLATLDPIGALASYDADVLGKLRDGLVIESEGVLGFLNQQAPDPYDEPSAQGGGAGAVDPVVPAKPQDPVSKRGDVWLLGPHRLVCGDSTDEAVVDLAVAGLGPVVACWTDPPYNVAVEGQAGTIENDDLPDVEFAALLAGAFEQLARVLVPGGPFYVAHASSTARQFEEALEAAGLRIAQPLVWAKNSLVLGRSDYQWMHELIFYGWRPGAAHRWYGGRTHTTVLDDPEVEYLLEPDGTVRLTSGDRTWLVRGQDVEVVALDHDVLRYARPRSSHEHPTMKPVGLIARCLRNSTQPGDVVLDLFGGSGSTLIAAHEGHRVAALVELDPGYCDVICRRFQAHTGLSPTRAGVPHDFGGTT